MAMESHDPAQPDNNEVSTEDIRFVCRQSIYPSKPLCRGCYKRTHLSELISLRKRKQKAQPAAQ